MSETIEEYNGIVDYSGCFDENGNWKEGYRNQDKYRDPPIIINQAQCISQAHGDNFSLYHGDSV